MKPPKNALTAVLLALGAILIAAGAAAGQPEQVLAKAIRICLECIGIG